MWRPGTPRSLRQESCEGDTRPAAIARRHGTKSSQGGGLELQSGYALPPFQATASRLTLIDAQSHLDCRAAPARDLAADDTGLCREDRSRVPGLTWDRFEENERRLRDNARAYGVVGRRGPPREGSALLQGLATCGVCGRNMTVRYQNRKRRQYPYYTCVREGIETASAKCQSISGAAIDDAVGELLVELMTPVTLEVALQVQDELAARAGEADLWRSQQVQRTREEADLARQRFMQTHPDNRMVADVLEAEWNAKLRALDEAQRELERSRAEPGQGLDDEQRQRILALASNFPRLWNDPGTPHRERKRMARLLIEDVTLTKATRSLGVRLRGGATRQLTWVPERHVSEVYRTSDEVVAEVDRLLNDHTDGEIAKILNERGYRSGYGHAFNAMLVKVVRDNYALKSRYDRLRDRGLVTVHDAAARLAVTTDTVHRWRKAGLLRGHAYNDRPDYLIEIPDPPPTKQPRRELSKRRRFPELARQPDNEVQYEA